jgi:hypothetical protein
MVFTCAAPHIKSKGLPISGLLASKYLFTHNNNRSRLAKSSYFLYNNFHQCMKSKEHLYIYIYQVFGKNQIFFLINKDLLQHIGEELHVSRTVIVFRLGKAREIIR